MGQPRGVRPLRRVLRVPRLRPRRHAVRGPDPDDLVRRLLRRRVPGRCRRGRHLRRLGEPLDRTAEQIARIHREAAAAGRSTPPRIHAAFRPIIAPTEELAWEKAHAILGRIEARKAALGGTLSRRHSIDAPQNAGSQRLLEIAAQGERFDTALWTATAKATGGAGNSNALVGTPETVAQALLAYYDLGVRVISARGYDLLHDAADFGRYVIPLVREGVAERDAAAARAA